MRKLNLDVIRRSSSQYHAIVNADALRFTPRHLNGVRTDLLN